MTSCARTPNTFNKTAFDYQWFCLLIIFTFELIKEIIAPFRR